MIMENEKQLKVVPFDLIDDWLSGKLDPTFELYLEPCNPQGVSIFDVMDAIGRPYQYPPRVSEDND